MASSKPRRALLALTALSAATFGALFMAGAPAGASKPLAIAMLQNASGTKIGTVTFKGDGVFGDTVADRVEVRLFLPADAPGLGAFHGLHVHQSGECTAPFTSAGGHWNHESNAGAKHGSHTGDLPSVLVSPEGRAYTEFETHRFDVTDLFDANGSAVVLHAGPDNFANVPISPEKYADLSGWFDAPGGTAATGDAGGRYGCGVVRDR